MCLWAKAPFRLRISKAEGRYTKRATERWLFCLIFIYTVFIQFLSVYLSVGHDTPEMKFPISHSTNDHSQKKPFFLALTWKHVTLYL